MKKTTSDFSLLKRLSIFATVVEQGSFTAAAKALDMSRPAISGQIARLENQLNTRLFHRTTRKLSLTMDGERLYPHANAIQAAFLTAIQTLDADALKGRIRMTTTTDFAIEWLIPKLCIFRNLHPGIHIDLISSDETLDLVHDRIDLAIRTGITTDPQLVARPLFRESLALYASPHYLENHGIPQSLAEAEHHRWLLLTQLTRPAIDLWNNHKQSSIQPKEVWYSNSPTVLVAQIQAGLGLGLALPTIVQKSVQEGTLRHILTDWKGHTMTTSLVYSSRRYMPKRVQILQDFLLQERVTK